MRRAIALAIALAATPAVAVPRYCWEPIPGANVYNFYHGGPVEPPPVSPPLGVTWNNAPRPWVCKQSSPSSVCTSTLCCSLFPDEPGVLVYYVLTAEDTTAPGSESMTMENPCP